MWSELWFSVCRIRRLRVLCKRFIEGVDMRMFFLFGEFSWFGCIFKDFMYKILVCLDV